APGDSLEIFKTVLGQLERPLDVTLGVTDGHDPARWPESLAYHFGDSPHRFELKRSEAENAHPWAQDYIKAGEWKGELRILVPRRLFEGRAADGETYRPLLDALQGEGYVRSKLSW